MKKIILIITILFFISGCGGKNERRIMVGLVNFISGTVYIISADGKETAAVQGLPVDRGMKIRTKGNKSLCEIYIDENVIKIFGDTEISINTLTRDKKTEVEKTYLSLKSGRCFFKIKNRLMKNQDFNVRTKNCTAAVRGTEFFVSDIGKSDSIACLDGKVQVKSEKQNSTVEIGAGERVVANGKSKPVKSEIESKYIDALEKDAEVKPLTEENSQTFDKIGTGDKAALAVIRKKMKELRTPKEIKESEKVEDDEGDRVNLFNFRIK